MWRLRQTLTMKEKARGCLSNECPWISQRDAAQSEFLKYVNFSATSKLRLGAIITTQGYQKLSCPVQPWLANQN